MVIREVGFTLFPERFWNIQTRNGIEVMHI